MNDRGIIICVGIAFLIFIFLWAYFKNKKVKTGNYGNYSYYDKLTDRLDAKLGHDSSFMIQHYLDPENCPLYGDLPTLSQLVNLKQNNPSKYEELVNDGTVKRAVNIKALKTWLLLGSTNVDKFKHFMNQVNQLNIDKVDLLNLENALKNQLSKTQ